MAEPFYAEIRIFSFNFAPVGWAFCNGQLLPISQNTALFSLLGTFYGGDGKSTFALPNLQGSVPLHPNRDNLQLSNYDLGQSGGSATVALIQSEMPAHTHALQALSQADQSGNSGSPSNHVPGRSSFYNNTNGAPLVNMSFSAIAPMGNGAPHNNMQPYLTLNFCIALQGIYPPRS